MRRAREFFGHLLAAGVVEILKVLAGLVFAAGFSVMLGRFLSLALPWFDQNKWLVAITFGGGGMLLFLTLYERFHRSRPQFSALPADFQLLEKTVRMVYKDREHMEYTKKHRLRALRDGLDRYVDKYLWTGDNLPTVRSKVRGHTFLPTTRKNYWQHYEVLFGRHLNRKEEVETELVWSLSDTSHTAIPFISATIDEPTDLLSLALEVPVEWGVNEVICEMASGGSAKRPLSSHSLAVNQQGKVEWVVKKPKLLHHYEMRWPLPD